jgi:hypothetical protein
VPGQQGPDRRWSPPDEQAKQTWRGSEVVGRKEMMVMMVIDGDVLAHPRPNGRARRCVRRSSGMLVAFNFLDSDQNMPIHTHHPHHST